VKSQKNSVLQSGFEHSKKQEWIGKNFDQKDGNDERDSNVPNIRYKYRQDTLQEELDYIAFCALKEHMKK